MKWVSRLIFWVILGVAGYYAEPYITPKLLSLEKKAPLAAEEPSSPVETLAAEEEEEKAQKVVTAEPIVEEPTMEEPTTAEPQVTELPAEEAVNSQELVIKGEMEGSYPAPPAWLADVDPDTFPKSVKLKDKAEFFPSLMEQPIVLEKDSEVEFLKLEGETLTVSLNKPNTSGQVPVMATDLTERLGLQMNSSTAEKPQKNAGNEAGSESTEEAATQVEQEKTVSTPPEEKETVIDEPVSPPQPSQGGNRTLSEAQIVSLMQSAIKLGQVKEFNYNQVTNWKAGKDEVIEGKARQIGELSYRATTIFGEREIVARAIIKDGKIEKWIWPNSGMEIK